MRMVVIITGREDTAEVRPAGARIAPNVQIHWELFDHCKPLGNAFSGLGAFMVAFRNEEI
jgi:hypothetical protein